MKLKFYFVFIIFNNIFLSLEGKIYKNKELESQSIKEQIFQLITNESDNFEITKRVKDNIITKKEQHLRKLNLESEYLEQLISDIINKDEREIEELVEQLNKIMINIFSTQKEILKKSDNEKKIIDNLRKEIKLLKDNYSFNITISYILIISIILLYITYGCFKQLSKAQGKKGYNRTVDKFKIIN